MATSKLPQHGFARTSQWTWAGIVSETPDHISGSFKLTPAQINPSLYELWPNPFSVTYIVTLKGSDSIETKMVVENTGDGPFEFTALLHTYFKVDDIDKCQVEGLEGYVALFWKLNRLLAQLNLFTEQPTSTK